MTMVVKILTSLKDLDCLAIEFLKCSDDEAVHITSQPLPYDMSYSLVSERLARFAIERTKGHNRRLTRLSCSQDRSNLVSKEQ